MMLTDSVILKREIEAAKNLRHVLHANPELSHQEAETAKTLLAYLADTPGLTINKGVAGHGIVVDLEGNSTATERIAFRADMDALPVRETTGLACASNAQGIMHACGHDIHMTILAGLIRTLAQQKEFLPFNYRFIFQPAEEDSRKGGAIDMIREGVLDDVDRIFGGHVWPDLELGEIGTTPGAIMASCDTLAVDVTGLGSHAAQPHLGADAAVALASILMSLQTIVSRRLDPLAASALTIGRLEAGTRHNIVAESARLEGTFRTLSQEARTWFLGAVQEIASNAAQTYGTRAKTVVTTGYPPLVNDAELTAMACNTFKEMHGITPLKSSPKLISEDFSFYGEKIPALFLWFGASTEENRKQHPQQLHNSYFSPDEEVIAVGIRAFYALATEKSTSKILAKGVKKE